MQGSIGALIIQNTHIPLAGGASSFLRTGIGTFLPGTALKEQFKHLVSCILKC